MQELEACRSIFLKWTVSALPVTSLMTSPYKY